MKLEGPVLVVGAGLLGTSIGLALRRRGVDVALRDVNPENLRIATTIGAANVEADDVEPAAGRGRRAAGPPRRAGRRPRCGARDATVTDVGSVKGAPLAAVRDLAPDDVARYVGSHPMAGSERSGPFAATRVAVRRPPVGGHPARGAPTRPPSRLVTALARACGATPVTFSPEEHDQAVARTSHLPHLLAAMAAGRLTDAPARAPRAVRPGRPRRHPDRRRRPGAVAADPHREHRRADRAAARRARRRGHAARRARRRRPAPAGRDPGPRGRRHGGHPRQARRARRAPRPRCSSPYPTTRASWPGCSPTRARSASTSRTCASTTTRAGSTAWSSSRSATDHVDHLLSSLEDRGWTTHR